jgi:hypothetical protein
MAQLEGFHVCAEKNKPKRGSNQEWIYPRSEDVLKECGMKMMEEYTDPLVDDRYVHGNLPNPQ